MAPSNEFSFRGDLLQFACQQLGCSVDAPWDDKPSYQVMRHPVSRKWAGLIMSIPRRYIGLEPADVPVDVVNLKLDPLLVASLNTQEGYAPAWHMSKQNWITVRLDGSVSLDQVCALLEMSYSFAAPKPKRSKKKS